jgi:hypothetical protein
MDRYDSSSEPDTPVLPFLLFAGTAYYPDGGWADYQGRYPSQEAARTAYIARADQEGWQWYDIVDTRTWHCVESEGDRGMGLAPESEPC